MNELDGPSPSALAFLIVAVLVVLFGIYAIQERRCATAGGHSIMSVGNRFPVCVDDHGRKVGP